MSLYRVGLLLVATAALSGVVDANVNLQVASDPQLRRVVKPGETTVFVGDLVVISFPSNPSTGPANPNKDLKVEIINGDGLKKVATVFAPPAQPIPGRPGEIQTYLLVEKAEKTTVQVTPISGDGTAGKPLTFTFRVAVN